MKVASVYPKFSQPRWTGAENVKGKTILICADEGLGDTIQFVRYVPMLTARGARVILLVDEPTQPLLSGLSGVIQCISKSAGVSLPAFDMHCPICSLPLAFGTRLDSIPSFASYLPAPAEKRCRPRAPAFRKLPRTWHTETSSYSRSRPAALRHGLRTM